MWPTNQVKPVELHHPAHYAAHEFCTRPTYHMLCVVDLPHILCVRLDLAHSMWDWIQSIFCTARKAESSIQGSSVGPLQPVDQQHVTHPAHWAR